MTVNGRPATVIQSAFSSPEFSEDVALRYENGELDLVALDRLDYQGATSEHSP